MGDSWGELLVLAAGSMLVPAPLVVSLFLLRSSTAAGAAWTAGMTAVRLLQGLVLGLVLSDVSTAAGSAAWRDATVAVVLLVVGLLLLLTAARRLLAGDDPDAPPPRWAAMLEATGPGKAFALGAGIVAVSAKFWVFTLGAIAVLEEAAPGRAAGTIAYLVFALVAVLPGLLALVAVLVAPRPSRAALGRVADWLRRNDRWVVAGVGLGFGTWFVVKGLSDLGVL